MKKNEWMNGSADTPAFSVKIGDNDVTTRLENNLIGLTLTDNRGFEADQLDIELDDSQGVLQLPRRGAVLHVALGWKGKSLIVKGDFTVDEVEHSGAPDRLTIRARSADFRATLNMRRDKSWHETTVGAVVTEIAGRNQLDTALDAAMAAQTLDHIDQTNESDASFLTRLARRCGAVASVKAGRLMFIKPGQGMTASGRPLPIVTITRADGDGHRFSIADRDAYTGVTAHWLNTRKPQNKEVARVRRRKNPTSQEGNYLAGTDENVLVLGWTYANKANAMRAAKTKLERIQRGAATFSLQLAKGRAELYTEMPVRVSGFKKQIDESEWTITTLTHIMNDSGFTTNIELEVKTDEI